MNVNTAYQYVLDRLNELSSNSHQAITERQFVFTYNKVVLHWFKSRIKLSEKDKDFQESLQSYVKSKDLTFATRDSLLVSQLPDDYFYYKRVVGENCGECGLDVYAYNANEGNVNNLLKSDLDEPSIEWQETFFTITSNKLNFYIKDFTCGNIKLYYYRCPVEIEMEAYNGQDVNPDLNKVHLHEVLDIVALVLAGDITNPSYQAIFNFINNTQ